jgi:hypothetical protein
LNSKYFSYFLLFSILWLNGCSSNHIPTPTPTPSSPKSGSAQAPAAASEHKPDTVVPSVPTKVPDTRFDHIVIVIEENHSYKQIVGNKEAPYMQSLMGRGALFTNAHGITHPSQPNYLALFSGSAQGVIDDSCKGPFAAENLASELLGANHSFIGYSEDLPSVGFSKCSSQGYARKHNPWTQFTNISAELNRPLTDFPKDFTKLPTVSFVVPALKNDMHDGTVQEADSWLKAHLETYASWAETHNSLLIVTWDEDNFAKDNHIPLIITGARIKQGTYDNNINHYHVLRTIEDLYQLEPLGESKKVEGLTSIFK